MGWGLEWSVTVEDAITALGLGVIVARGVPRILPGGRGDAHFWLTYHPPPPPDLDPDPH
jgi:hypothetical protein